MNTILDLPYLSNASATHGKCEEMHLAEKFATVIFINDNGMQALYM